MTENDLKLLIENKVVPKCHVYQIDGKYQLWIKTKTPSYLMNSRKSIRLFASLDRVNRYLRDLSITQWTVNNNPPNYP